MSEPLLSSLAQDTREAIVFLHGFALDARMWRHQIEALARDYRILTIDLPGFGPQGRDLGDVVPAAEVERAMDAVRLDRAHFVGSSYGAAVVVDFALQHPASVASMTLTGPLLLGRRTDIAAWPKCVTFARDGDLTTALEVWLDDPLFATLRRDEERFEELREIVLDYGGAHWTGHVASCWGDTDPLLRLGDLDVPSLLITGERDLPSFVAMADAYQRALPRAQRAVVRGAGHLANLERPADWNAVFRDFLASAGRVAHAETAPVQPKPLAE